MSVMRGLPWVESVDAKIDRAREHLDDIDAACQVFRRAVKHHRVPKLDPNKNTTWLVWWTDFESSQPPISLSIRIGELLYNLRSALDNLVCALVRMERGTYAASCSGNSFPIHTNRDAFDAESARVLRGVPSQARTLIQGLQPYNRGSGTADLDPLSILNVLRNRWAHRALHLGLAFHRDTQFIIIDSATKQTLAHASLPGTVFPSQEPQTVPLAIPADRFPAAVDVVTGSTGGICFRSEGPWAERAVNEVLAGCLEYAEHHVCARFRPFFR